MRNKLKPCKCGLYQKLNEFGLTDENYIRHTWDLCSFNYPLGA